MLAYSVCCLLLWLFAFVDGVIAVMTSQLLPCLSASYVYRHCHHLLLGVLANLLSGTAWRCLLMEDEVGMGNEEEEVQPSCHVCLLPVTVDDDDGDDGGGW